MAKLTALGHLGMAFETTYGTAVVPVSYVPYDTVKVEDDIKKIVDEGRRGVMSKEFAVYNATKSSKIDIASNLYPDILGFFLKAMLGQGSVTGTAPNFTHTFKVVNALSPSMTLQDNNSITERQYPGAVISELSIKFDTENVAKLSAKLVSKVSTIGTPTTPTITAVAPFMGFQSTLSIPAANTNMVGGEFTLKREAKLIYGANNTQDPSKFSSGRISAEGKITFDVEDESELLLYLNGTQPVMTLTLAQNANTSLAITCNKIDITKATLDRSQEFVRCDLQFRAVFNTTDAGICTVVLKNQVATY